MYYYILRNQCIDNSMHCPGYDANALKADLRSQVMGEVNRYRYKNADLLIRGVRDFLKGIDWLEQTDAEALHKEIMAYGYKAQPVDQLDVPFDYSRYLYATKEEGQAEKTQGQADPQRLAGAPHPRKHRCEHDAHDRLQCLPRAEGAEL